jgi:hypothetical protein
MHRVCIVCLTETTHDVQVTLYKLYCFRQTVEHIYNEQFNNEFMPVFSYGQEESCEHFIGGDEICF